MTMEEKKTVVDNSVFLNGILERINDLVSDETMKEIRLRLSAYVDDYQIEQKNFSVALRNNMPDAYKHFLVTKKIEGLSQKTLDNYKQHLDIFFDCVTFPIEQITSQTVQVFIYNYSKEIHGTATTTPSASTMRQFQSVLNSFFGWCADNGYISKNPCASLGTIKTQKKEIDVLSEEQMKKLLDASRNLNTDAESKRAYAIVETFISTGLRVGELVNIKLDSILWNSTIENMIPLKIENGKGNKDRTEFLTDEAAIAILDYLKVRNSKSEYLFASLTDENNMNPLTTRTVQNLISRLGKMIGVETCHPHMIRHTVGTEMAKKGTSIHLVQRMLGHSSAAVTTKYYVKAEEKQIAREVAEKLSIC